MSAAPAPYRNAGFFLLELRNNPTGYSAFVRSRERAWDEELREPIEVCVHHLLCLIIRTIESGLSGSAGDMRLTKAELVAFHRQGGAPSGGAPAGLMPATGAGNFAGLSQAASPTAAGGLSVFWQGGRRSPAVGEAPSPSSSTASPLSGESKPS